MSKFIKSMNEKEFKFFHVFIYLLVVTLIVILIFLSLNEVLNLGLYIILIIGFLLIYKSLQKTISISIYDLLLNDINLDKFESFNKIFYKRPNIFIFSQWNNIYNSNRVALEFYKGNFIESLDIIKDLNNRRVSSNIKMSIISFEALNRIFLGENIDIIEYQEQLSKVKVSNKNKNRVEALEKNIKTYYDVLIDKKTKGSLIVRRKSKLSNLFDLYIAMNKAYNWNIENKYEKYRSELSKNNSQLYIVRKAKAGL